MDEKQPIDAAVEIATERTADAQEAFVESPPGSGQLVRLAHTVEHRAEDLEILAEDAADQVVPPTK